MSGEPSRIDSSDSGEAKARNAAPDAIQSVVVLVHGIRTYAPWVAMIRTELESVGIVVEPTNYGRFDTLRFLLPISGIRRKPIAKVWESIQEVRALYPNAQISFIAHSFGTYILANILQNQAHFKADKIVFCGSVVQYDFPFFQISTRFTRIINEVSSRDIWPVIAESITRGYGSAGTFGFKVPRIRDRWHAGFSHSQYLTREFCKKFWVPFFKDGVVVEGDISLDPSPAWLILISIVKIKYVLLLTVFAIGFSVYWNTYKVSYPKPVDPLSQEKNIQSIPHDPTTTDKLGPRPGDNCHIISETDYTKFPNTTRLSWYCKNP
jgi:hypothetical protein